LVTRLYVICHGSMYVLPKLLLCYNRTALSMSPVTNGNGHIVTMKLIASYIRSARKHDIIPDKTIIITLSSRKP